MSDPKHDERHDAVWLLLPWYANGTLETAERLLVEDHLAGCPGCLEEVARCNGLAAALRGRPEIAPSPHPLQLARLMERLDAAEAGDASDGSDASDVIHAIHASGAPDAVNAVHASGAIHASGAHDAVNAANAVNASDAIHAIHAGAATQAPAAAAGARARRRGASLLGGTPRPVRWALAGQLAALILLATALAFGPARRQPAMYRTLSEPSAPAASLPATSATSPAATAPQLRVVFDDTATAKQMRDVLLSTRGRLVDGPSPLGAYLLELPAPAPAAAAPPAGGVRGAGTGDLAPAPPAPRASPREAAPDSVGIVLAYLRSQPIVRFAEPVAGTGTPAPAPGTAAAAPQGVPGATPEVPPS